jgi:uncharacterized protein (DUF433 family)
MNCMIIYGMLDIYKGIITIEQGKRSGKPCIREYAYFS